MPYTYLWSPGLVPKPKDWGPEIDIAGFVFLDLASTFKPSADLTSFLEAGEPPIYIGFGSIVVDDPDRFTQMIFEAVTKAGVRALVSKGWGGLGQGTVPDNVFLLDNTPHDWLFPRVRAVVHHGGAGTTAIGLKCGRPTMIVPFFGDQPFWGAMIGASGAGTKPVPYKDLDVDKLAAGIKECMTDEALQAAQEVAKSIEDEGDGAANAVESFHQTLAMRGDRSMRCSILEDRVAVWTLKKSSLRLSALAAELLVERKKLSWKQLRLNRHCDWNDFGGPGEPLSGGLTAIGGVVTDMAVGVGRVPFKIAKRARRRSEHEAKVKKHEEKRARKSIDAGTQKTSTNGAVVTRKPPTEMETPVQPKSPIHPADNKLGAVKSVTINDPKEAETVQDTSKHLIPQTLATNAMPPLSPDDRSKMSYPGGDPLSQDSHRPPQSSNSSQAEAPMPLTAETETSSILTADPPPITQEIVEEIGAGFGQSAAAIARAPMDLSLAIAQGFHNAPRLYGDTTVRKVERITGFHSGMRAARQEFVYGIYDGVTGLWVLPYRGAKDGGALGFIKGCGMGLTGFVLKDVSAIVGPWGYGIKGIEKELFKGKQRKLTNFIRKARILDGQREASAEYQTPRAKKEITHKVLAAWDIVRQVNKMIVEDNMAKGPVVGRWRTFRERKQWHDKKVLENSNTAAEAIDLKKSGLPLAEIEQRQRKEWADAGVGV